MSKIFYYDSPVGVLELSGSEDGLESLYFKSGYKPSRLIPDELFDAVRQLSEYFMGQRRNFSLELKYSGTVFQEKVWNNLLKIPYGETVTYGEVAKRIGNSGAVRAVGHANAMNPISIIIPCHRVIGNSGKLVGYGGGLDNKRWLIEFEKRYSGIGLFAGK